MLHTVVGSNDDKLNFVFDTDLTNCLYLKAYSDTSPVSTSNLKSVFSPAIINILTSSLFFFSMKLFWVF